MIESTDTDCSGRSAPRDHGAAMVEFAFILPILVLLLVGIIQFGLAYSAQVSIQGAAREGARALALGEPNNVVDAAVYGAAGSATVTAINKSGCPTPPDSSKSATVTVNATFTFSIPFINLGTRTFYATARMRCGL